MYECTSLIIIPRLLFVNFLALPYLLRFVLKFFKCFFILMGIKIHCLLKTMVGEESNLKYTDSVVNSLAFLVTVYKH